MATAVANTWLYDTGTGGGGGVTPGDNLPPAVTIVAITVTDNYDGTAGVAVEWRKSASATPANFSGIELFLEDPDHSAGPSAPMDGSVPLDSSSTLQGDWTTATVSKYHGTPALFRVNLTDAARQARVYAPSYNATHPAVPVRATDPNPSPNMAFTIPAAQFKYVIGQEFTWLAIAPYWVNVVPDYENPAGPQYGLDFFYTAPDPTVPLPPGMAAFAGCHIDYLMPDASISTGGPDLWVNDREHWNVRGYPVGATPATIGVYFCSIDVRGRVNTPIDGVTPFVQFTIDLNPTPVVGNLILTNPRSEYFVDGTIVARVDASWMPPVSNQYTGMALYRVDAQNPKLYATLPVGSNRFTITENQWPTTPQDWLITVITLDRNGKLSDDPHNPTHSPTAIWHIGPPTLGGPGMEHVAGQANIAGTHVTVEQQLSNDGVMMMRFVIGPWINPNDPNFGGVSIARTLAGDLNNPVWWDASQNATSLTTPWEPATEATQFDFWLVSRDLQNNRNTLGPGITPMILVNFIPKPGEIIATRMPVGWWNTSEFSWDGVSPNAFSVNQIVTQKIWAGRQIVVGGGYGTAASSFAGNQNGQIAVMNYQNQMVGWIGQQDGTGSGTEGPHTVFGAWFRELYVGGGGPPTAPLYATNSGILILGGFDVTTALGTTVYPYLSVRDEYGIEKGRVGAHLAWGFPTTDSYGQPTPQIGGAWFTEIAIGGQNFTDWRILSKRANNPANLYEPDSVRIRNINNFFIEYPQTSINAPYRLKMGMDWFAGPAVGGRQFPGLEIQRISVTNGQGSGNETGHRSVLINRGLILESPDNYPNRQRAYLITWNGDQGGNDAPPFWGEFGIDDYAGRNRCLISGGPEPTIRLINAVTNQDVIGGDTSSGYWMARRVFAGFWGQEWASLGIGVNQGELYLQNGQVAGYVAEAFGGTNGAAFECFNKISGVQGFAAGFDAGGSYLFLKEGGGTQTILMYGNGGVIASRLMNVYNNYGATTIQINGNSAGIWCSGQIEADVAFRVGGYVGATFTGIFQGLGGSWYQLSFAGGICYSLWGPLAGQAARDAGIEEGYTGDLTLADGSTIQVKYGRILAKGATQ